MIGCLPDDSEMRIDMIKVTRINKQEKFWVNENEIEFMEETPDTILSMVSGRKVPVAETAEEVVRLIAQVRYPVVVSRDESGEIRE
jgi:flagellar protein FlbD